jgi:hypothetical protein
MAVTPLTVYTVPFQGDMDLTTNLTIPTAEMSYVNDGYTVMMVVNNEDNMGNDLTVTITGVRDNAGRGKTLTETVENEGGRYLFGPFRPIWWNDSGDIQVSFSTGDTMGVPNSLDNIGVKVMKLQF